MTSFSDVGLLPWVTKSCDAMSLYNPTEVQQQTIPLVLEGANVLASSKTGSGKTACFCLPILQKLSEDPYGVFALIITPVRELASQIADQFISLGRPIDVSVMTVFGGRSNLGQTASLAQRPHVVIATPGRLAELLRGDPELKSVLRRLKFLVLDEADRLLIPGFESDLAEIITALPPRNQRQTLLFSATMTSAVSSLVQKFGDMEIVTVGESIPAADSLAHEYVFLPSAVKLTFLFNVISETFASESIIIFTSSIRACQLTASTLEKLLPKQVVCLHSLLESQGRRDAAIGKFRNGNARILIATEVAARGLDLPAVNVVIHFELPRETTEYLHRAGRTARAGRTGRSIALVSESEVQLLQAIEAEQNILFSEFAAFEGEIEEKIVKSLGKISKAKNEAEILLSEIGFDERLKERKRKRTVS